MTGPDMAENDGTDFREKKCTKIWNCAKWNTCSCCRYSQLQCCCRSHALHTPFLVALGQMVCTCINDRQTSSQTDRLTNSVFPFFIPLEVTVPNLVALGQAVCASIKDRERERGFHWLRHAVLYCCHLEGWKS